MGDGLLPRDASNSHGGASGNAALSQRPPASTPRPRARRRTSAGSASASRSPWFRTASTSPSSRPTRRRTEAIVEGLLFLSRIHPKKGIPILLRAWRKVERRHPDWELVVAGPDEIGHLSQVRALAGELGLQRVSFPGPAYGDAKAALYRSADLFVLPTHSENFGMAIAEALAYAVPVITTTGAPWAGLEEHGCGWWIELSEGNLVDALRYGHGPAAGAARGDGPSRPALDGTVLWLGPDRQGDEVGLRMAARRRAAASLHRDRLALR